MIELSELVHDGYFGVGNVGVLLVGLSRLDCRSYIVLFTVKIVVAVGVFNFDGQPSQRDSPKLLG